MEIKKVHYNINFQIKTEKRAILKEVIENYRIENNYYINYSINKKNKEYLNVYVDENGNFNFNNKKYYNLGSLLHENNIVPKLFDTNVKTPKYKNKLIKLEHAKDIEMKKIFTKYDKLFNKKFNTINGINDIYEWYTGSVFFKDYEWCKISNSLKELFDIKENGSYIYSMPIDNGVLLRGYKIYYYFSTNVSRFNKPNLKQIKEWFNNINIFIKRVERALKDFKVENKYDKKLLLAVVDNLRNIILLLTNCELMRLSDNGKDFIYDESYSNKDINDYFSLIEEYQEIIENICFCNKVNKVTIKVKKIIQKLMKMNNSTLQKVSKIDNNFILSKCFNPLREIDNYFENYIVINDVIGKLKLEGKNINVIGLLYGGLEIPFIIKRILGKKVSLSFLFENHGMYLDRQSKDKDIIDVDIKKFGSLNQNRDTYIVDDNMMSGITMQFALNKLNLNNFNNIKGFIIIRHPNLNRLPQLEHFNVGVNLDLVNKCIFGMITPTPYTKIKENTNFNNMFVNELNIFSIMTEVFLKALYCNNSFIKDSQVDIFKGFSEGKNDKI